MVQGAYSHGIEVVSQYLGCSPEVWCLSLVASPINQAAACMQTVAELPTPLPTLSISSYVHSSSLPRLYL